MRKSVLVVLVLGLVGLGAVAVTNNVGAQKVLNPGAFSLESTGGQLLVGNILDVPLTPNPVPQCSDGQDNDADTRFDLLDPQCDPGPAGQPASSDDSELKNGFQPKEDVSISGTIDRNGVVSIPPTGVQLPTTFVPLPTGDVLTAEVVPTETTSGSIDPLTGAVELNVAFRVQISGSINGAALAGSCSIGTNGNPIRLNLITGRKDPVGTAGALTGSPYNPNDGRTILVDNAFVVPGASGCLAGFFNLNQVINDQAQIPSGAGRNAAVFAGRTTPVLERAVQPVITSTPAQLGGPAPYTATFNGAGSTVAAQPATYRWTFSDGTSATGVEVTKVFANAGNQAASLTITDADGDEATRTTFFVVSPGDGTTTSTTSTTVAPTTSTTSTTVAPTTTTTTQPQPTDDAVDLRIRGVVNYENSGSGVGGIDVERDQFGVSRVTGELQIAGADGGTATVATNVNRVWILPLWTGQVRVSDPDAGVRLTAPVFGRLSSSGATVTGTTNWFLTGAFPNLIRPYTLTWSATDAD